MIFHHDTHQGMSYCWPYDAMYQQLDAEYWDNNNINIKTLKVSISHTYEDAKENPFYTGLIYHFGETGGYTSIEVLIEPSSRERKAMLDFLLFRDRTPGNSYDWLLENGLWFWRKGIGGPPPESGEPGLFDILRNEHLPETPYDDHIRYRDQPYWQNWLRNH